MIEIMVDLQGGAKAPLYEKIYQYIKGDITGGKILKGEKLPSTRQLAQHLSVSRSTVEMAYEQLLAEGYIQSEPCRGFFVCDITDLYQFREKEREKRRAATAEYIPEKERLIDFSPYAIDTGHFPYDRWRKINKYVLMDDREELLLAGDGQGDYGLRKAITGYLHHARGVNCRPADMIIGAGNEYLEILLAQILGGNQKVLMENPTYRPAYDTFSNIGYKVETVRIEEGGLAVETVGRVNPDLVYIMPSHQFPLGTVMPLKQRLELLKWASEKENRYLLEDDHDSEYRYRGKPIPSLQSVDGQGKVIYLGTFSKSIAPSLRISYMVLPQKLIEQYRNRCGFYAATVPKIQQEVLREFIEGGHFERHLNKMRGIYRSKHDFLLGELKKRAWAAEIKGDHAGLHLLVKTVCDMTEEELCKKALERGVKVSGMSEHFVGEAPKDSTPVLLLGFGKLNEEQMKKGLGILDAILK